MGMVEAWVKFSRTPRAPLMETFSSSGLLMAFCTASTAALSPVASPIPIMAIPRSDITVRTSAKSTLM